MVLGNTDLIRIWSELQVFMQVHTPSVLNNAHKVTKPEAAKLTGLANSQALLLQQN